MSMSADHRVIAQLRLIRAEDAQTQALAEALQQSGQGIATKLDIAELKTEIQAMLNRQLQIMLGVMVALTAIYAALVKLL